MRRSVTLSKFPCMILRRDRHRRENCFHVQEVVLHPIDKKLYDDIIDNARNIFLAREHEDNISLREFTQNTFTIGDNNFTNDNIIACSINDFVNDETEFNPVSSIKKIGGEDFSQWIPAKYDKEKNCGYKENDDAPMFMVESFDPIEVFNYKLGRVGNPDYFVVITTHKTEYLEV